MTVYLHEWQLSVKLDAPYFTAGNDSLDADYDGFLYRDPKGRVALAGSQLQGNFRHFLLMLCKAYEETMQEPLVEKQQVKRWLGEKAISYDDIDEDAPTSDMPNSSACLRFLDIPLTGHDELISKASRINKTGIRINPHRGSINHGSLRVLEQADAQGAQLIFNRDDDMPVSIFLIGEKDDKQAFENCFEQFKTWIVALGQNKAQGFGWVSDARDAICLTPTHSAQISFRDANKNENSNYEIKYRFDAPLLIDPDLHSGNLRISADHFSGAYIKAAIAELGSKIDEEFQKNYGKVLAQVHVGFSYPVGKVPKAKDIGLDNCTLNNSPTKIQTLDANHWKQKIGFSVGATKHKTSLEYFTTTRTAIEGEGVRAEKGQLYTTRFLSHEELELTVKVDLSNCSDSAKALQLLNLFESRALMIGKSRSRIISAEYEVKNAHEPFNKAQKIKLTLLSPACLFSMEDLECLSKDSDLMNAYTNVFTRMELGSLEDFFTYEFMLGGNKVLNKPREKGGKAIHYPYVMTGAGSTFFLNAVNSDKLNELVKYGLAGPEQNRRWQKTNFLRENGYGAVQVDVLDASDA